MTNEEAFRQGFKAGTSAAVFGPQPITEQDAVDDFNSRDKDGYVRSGVRPELPQHEERRNMDPARPALSSYQERVDEWIQATFGPDVSQKERAHRFLEEALELAQAAGCERNEAMALVHYTFNRPVGSLCMEVGAVMNTLAALCTSFYVDLDAEAERELVRVWGIKDAIREKWLNKPRVGPLPAATPVFTGDEAMGTIYCDGKRLSVDDILGALNLAAGAMPPPPGGPRVRQTIRHRFMDQLNAGQVEQAWLSRVVGRHVNVVEEWRCEHHAFAALGGAHDPGRVMLLWRNREPVGISVIVRDDMNFSELLIVEFDVG